MTTSPIRLNPSLIEAAEKEALLQKRSTPKQIEFWADLGRAVERVIDLSDVFAVVQGLKKLKIEAVASVGVEPEDLFNDLDARRTNGTLASEVSSAAIYFEASRQRPGLLDRVDTATGKRLTGRFRNGRFEAIG
jgi:hypothetical protein